MLSIFFLLWATLAFSQQFEYRLEGSFQTKPSVQDTNTTTINYSIYWNETETDIQGLYEDNFLTLGRRLLLSGSKDLEGRKFNVILPVEVYRIRQILLTTPETEPFSGALPMSIITKDNVGGTIDNLSTTGLITYTPPPLP